MKKKRDRGISFPRFREEKKRRGYRKDRDAWWERGRLDLGERHYNRVYTSSPAEEDAGVGVLLESLARSAVTELPRPIRLARVYTRIENTLLHLQVAYLFAAGPQYFPFSTISY